MMEELEELLHLSSESGLQFEEVGAALYFAYLNSSAKRDDRVFPALFRGGFVEPHGKLTHKGFAAASSLAYILVEENSSKLMELIKGFGGRLVRVIALGFKDHRGFLLVDGGKPQDWELISPLKGGEEQLLADLLSMQPPIRKRALRFMEVLNRSGLTLRKVQEGEIVIIGPPELRGYLISATSKSRMDEIALRFFQRPDPSLMERIALEIVGEEKTV